MNLNYFNFDGNWEYEIELPFLAGFQERNGSYNFKSSDKPNKGLFKIEFEDDLTENPDPYQEQLNTLKYIFENQKSISKSIIERTLLELPEILVNYGLEAEEEYLKLSPEKIKNLIGISTVFIKIISKEGYSYFDISGGCNWDEEHGLNLLFHKDRVISFGSIDGGSIYEAEKDNGTYQPNDNDNDDLKREKPRKYLPHPKYNKLKPSQKFANETYEYTLISYGYNEEFIKGVESGEININGKWISQDITYLEAACWFKNNEIVAYLLSKNAKIRYALHRCVVYVDNPQAIQLLLAKGANINFQDASGNTVLFELVKSIESLYRYRSQNHCRKMNRLDLIIEANKNKVEELKNRIKDLIHLGANPYIKNSYGFSSFDIMRNAEENSRIEVNKYLKMCWNERKTVANSLLKAVRSWWQKLFGSE